MGGDFKKNFEKYQKNNEEVRFLMVGTLEPRKGHLDIINAIYFLNKNHKLDIRLDIIGNLGWHYENILKKINYVKKQNCKVFSIQEFQIKNCLCIIQNLQQSLRLPLMKDRTSNYGSIL